MQKILLYYPPTSENENKIMFNFPLPVLAACSLIDESKYDIRVECGLQKSMDVLIENNKDALCLGISIMTGTQIKLGLKLAERFRAVNTNVPIIWGGFHASSLVDETLRNRFVDIVVRSYGEIAFRDLVAALDMGKDVGVIKGISFKVNGRIKHNEDSEIPKMKDMPPVPYHLFDVAEFIRNDHSKSIPYVSSRGCPNRCGFCSEYVISRRKWNPRSSEQVVEDIVYLKEKYNPEAIRMVDSNFFANEKRVREICNGLVERNVGINLMKLNADAFFLSKYSDGTLQLMRSAGITNVLIGIESGYEPALKCIDKPATKDQAYNASLKLRINGISVGHSMMVGFPYDLPFSQMKQKHRTEIIETLKFIYELSLYGIPGDYYPVFFFTPYPGTILYDRYIKLGFSPPNSLDGWASVNLNQLNAPWICKETHNMIENGKKLVYLFAGKSERTWKIYQYYRFKYMIPKKLYKQLVIYVSNRVNELLYRRLHAGIVQLPKILEWWYAFELKYFYGRAGDENLSLNYILMLKARDVLRNILSWIGLPPNSFDELIRKIRGT